MFGLLGWALDGLFLFSPIVAIPFALSISYYFMLRLSLTFIFFHLTVLALKKFVPTIFVNLVRSPLQVPAFSDH